MNTIEDRLRAATQAAADTVTDCSQPPLRLPARARARAYRPLPRPRLTASRLMAPVAAATAIVAVVATIVVVRDVTAGNRASADRAAGAIKAAVPPFFLASVTTKAAPFFDARVVKIGRTATGRILATVRPPAPYRSFGVISAAGDDRTFVLAAQRSHIVFPPHAGVVFPPPSAFTVGPARLYLLRLHPGRTTAVTLTVLRKIPAFPGSVRVTAISLSPSGRRLAVELEPANNTSPASIRVYDLADGKFLAWSVPSTIQSTLLSASSALSWVGGNRFLATLLDANLPRNCRHGCVRLLDTTHGGGSILAASKTIFATTAIHRLASWFSALVTPDGSRMVLSGAAGKRAGNLTNFDKPLAYDIALPSGRILSRLTGRVGTGLRPLWAGTSSGPTIYGQVGPHIGLTATIYAGHRRVPLHLPARSLSAVW